MTGPLTIVINPAAGGGAAARSVPEVCAVLDGAGVRYTVLESKSLDHARSLAAAAAEGGDTVVAFGGDGLAGALAGATAGVAPDRTFGVIPCGRGNDFARAHSIPFDPAAAARVLAEGEPRPVDLIEITPAGPGDATAAPSGDGPAAPVGPGDATAAPAGTAAAAGTATSAGDAEPVVVAGSVYLGIAAVAGEIANQARVLRGPIVYNVGALRALLGWRPTTFRVEAAGADGGHAEHEFRGYGVVAANIPYFGAGMKVAPEAGSADGLLDIVLLRHAPKLTFVRALTKIKDGSHVHLDEIEVHRAASVTVSTDRPMLAGADGELLACAAPLPAGARLRLRAFPNALRLIVPR